MPTKFFLADRLVRKLTDTIRSAKAPMLGGAIANLVWGENSKRPEGKATFHETVRQIDKVMRQETGKGLISTTAYREERYEGEKADRREAGKIPSSFSRSE